MKTKNKRQRLTKIGVTAIVFCAVFVTTAVIKAGTGQNTTGWIWGGADTDNLQLSGDETGVGWISMNNTNPGAGGGVSYGVNIPTVNGDLSGRAWSENLGYIAFDNSNGYLNGCPAGNGACSARRNGNNIEGWARFVSIADALAVGNSGGCSFY